MDLPRNDIPAPDRIAPRGAIRIVGLQAEARAEDLSAIPPLWVDFNARAGEVNATPGTPAYGICMPADDDGAFRYIAGSEVAEMGTLPEGMVFALLAPQLYAVFTFDGPIWDLPVFVRSVWDTGLAAAGLTPARAPDFELYDERFDAQTGRGTVEIWIPLEPGDQAP